MSTNPYDFYNNTSLNRIYNSHGMQVLRKPIHIPDMDLGIGDADFTASVPLLVAYEPILQQPVASGINSIEDTYIKTVTPSLDMSTFSHMGYYGSPLEGI